MLRTNNFLSNSELLSEMDNFEQKEKFSVNFGEMFQNTWIAELVVYGPFVWLILRR